MDLIVAAIASPKPTPETRLQANIDVRLQQTGRTVPNE
jgi:hypothetical protein